MIDGYFVGMNITGVALIDSVSIAVTGNTINNAYIGMDLWSYKYSSHTTGYGLRNAKSPATRFASRRQHGQRPRQGHGRIGNIRCFGQSRLNAPCGHAHITINTVEYDLNPTAPIPTKRQYGIGYWDSTNSNTATAVKITGNTIKNAPVNAIRLGVNGSDFDVSENTIINPGSSLNASRVVGDQNGILIASTSA